MLTKISLIENTFISPVAMAAAKQESYLLLHRPTPWCRIALQVAGVIVSIVIALTVIAR